MIDPVIGALLGLAAIISGYSGRYEPPIILGMLSMFGMPDGFPINLVQASGPLALGCFLAYLRKPVISASQTSDAKADKGDS